MPVNWFLESIKWWYLCRGFAPMSLTQSYRSVMLGTFFTLFTPNRIGDGAGRISLLPPGNKSRGSWAFLNGSVAQTLATLLFGCIGLALIPAYLEPSDDIWWKVYAILRWPVWIGSTVILLLYVEPGWLRMAMEWTQPDSWIGKRIQTLQEYRRRQNGITLLISVVRYGVFATQFLLMLQLFGFAGEDFEAYLRIALIYLSTTLIPTVAAAELGLRESMAIMMLPAGGITESVVFTSTLLLWIINLLLPGMIGAVFFVNWKKHRAK